MGQEQGTEVGERPPRGDEPGATSTPQADGEAVVRLDSRTGGGAPAANQGKPEALSSSGADREAEPPALESMNVGAADPQTPSHMDAAAAGDRDRAGLPVLDRPVLGGSIDAADVADQGAPTADGGDPSAGSLTDFVPGRTGSEAGTGDAASVPVVSEDPSRGTSEESGVAEGVRTPH